MAGTPKLVAAVAGVAALAGVGVGLVPDPDRPSTSGSTNSVQATTAAPAPSFASPTVETEGPGTSIDTGRPDGEASSAPAQVPADAQQAVVRRIVDGDTLEVAAVTAGAVLSSTGTVDVRLLEIDTPETKDPNAPVQCFGPEATVELTRLAPIGSTVWVQNDQEVRDRYGRYLLYLWNTEGEFVNLSLVQSGHAEAVLYPPNDKHWPTISAAASTAQASNTGGWGACPAFGEPAQQTTTTQTPAPAPPDVPDPLPAPSPPPTQSGLPDQQMGPDTDCSDYPGPVVVAPGDPHRLDRDGDGIGCDDG